MKESNCAGTDPGIWSIGGAIGHARYYSRFIALQIKAALLGSPLEVYDKTPVGEPSAVNGI
jgi:hypothetical protein